MREKIQSVYIDQASKEHREMMDRVESLSVMLMKTVVGEKSTTGANALMNTLCDVILQCENPSKMARFVADELVALVDKNVASGRKQ
jgi:hypothetical protein